jgi:hypothetical protein
MAARQIGGQGTNEIKFGVSCGLHKTRKIDSCGPFLRAIIDYLEARLLKR